jgi:hypothetical protein
LCSSVDIAEPAGDGNGEKPRCASAGGPSGAMIVLTLLQMPSVEWSADCTVGPQSCTLCWSSVSDAPS